MNIKITIYNEIEFISNSSSEINDVWTLESSWYFNSISTIINLNRILKKIFQSSINNSNAFEETSEERISEEIKRYETNTEINQNAIPELTSINPNSKINIETSQGEISYKSVNNSVEFSLIQIVFLVLIYKNK